MHGVGRLGEIEVGDRLDEIVPFPGRRVLDLVEIGRAKPVERRAEPVLEGPAIAAPSRERTAHEHVDRHGAAGGQLDRAKEDRLVGAGRLALDVARGRRAPAANSMVESRASLRLAWPWPRLIARSDLSMSCQLNPTSPTPPLISACT